MTKRNTITVFEHQVLRTDKGVVQLTPDQLKALQSYHGNGVPYFSLTHNGVQFNEYVGVLQVGNTLIEVLPKADKYSNDENTWRSLLIGMLKVVSGFDIKSTSNASLKIKPNTILDLYFELFVKEIEYLINIGLIKKYRKTEGNNTALKGSLLFSKHIQKNITNQAKFYTRFNTYDKVHPLHQILYKALQLIKKLNTSASLQSRIGVLLLNFPEMPNINISEATFNKIIFNRKSITYKKAIEIARMLLLQYHPDVNKGKNDVLALMFDMNNLWEQFILVSLKRKREFKVEGQKQKYFWKPIGGKRRIIKPDIVITSEGNNYVIDTKWKNINNDPSIEDIRQMYVYQHYFNAKKAALVYPGKQGYYAGNFIEIINQNNISNLECGLLPIEPNIQIKDWQSNISNTIKNWAV